MHYTNTWQQEGDKIWSNRAFWIANDWNRSHIAALHNSWSCQRGCSKNRPILDCAIQIEKSLMLPPWQKTRWISMLQLACYPYLNCHFRILSFIFWRSKIYIGLVRVITSVSHSNVYKILLNWNTMKLMHKMVLILANHLAHCQLVQILLFWELRKDSQKCQFSPVLTVFSKNLKKTYLHKSFLAPWDSPLSKLPYTYV